MNRAFQTHRLRKTSDNVTEIQAGATVVTVWTHESNGERVVNIRISGRSVDFVELYQRKEKKK
jgi:hypothetical protein